MATEALTIKPREAATLLGVSENTLRAMTKAGHLLALPCAGKKRPRVRYARDEIQRFLREGARKPAAPTGQQTPPPGEMVPTKQRRRTPKAAGGSEPRWAPRPV